MLSCVFMTAVLLAAGDSPVSGDMLRFMDSALPEKEYVATHAETRKSPDKPWDAVVPVYQCFKTRVNYAWRQVYWRKDNLTADYYGEIFTFDDKTVRLHAETYPPKTTVDPPGHTWDERPDRFRCFVEENAPDWGLGRVFAPVDAATSWHHKGHLDTYVCHSFDEYNRQTAPKWQNHFLDNSVTIERYGPFSTVFDGEIPGWPAEETYKNFDEVIIVNQCMEHNAGRERFFFARKGPQYYGIVRWDNSVKKDGDWVVIDRTIGLKTAELEPRFSFDGMFERVRKDNRLKSGPENPLR